MAPMKPNHARAVNPRDGGAPYAEHMTTNRAPTDIHPKLVAAGLGGTLASVVVYLLSAFVFDGNPVPDDLVNLATLLIPIVVGLVSGYLKTGDPKEVTP